MISIPVRRLLSESAAHLEMTPLAGKRGLHKKITIPQIQKPGLALTGETANLHPGRIQVLGNSEVRYLDHLSRQDRARVLSKIGRLDIACFVVTHGRRPPNGLVEMGRRRGIPVLRSRLPTAVFILRVTKFLEDQLTETGSIHGVLVDVFGIGILLLGKSGIGKSECGLELVMKGHRLVADDIVHTQKKGPDSIYGTGIDLIKYHMEIRGLGIINIKDLFGVASVRDRKLIELVISLMEWNPKDHYERLGVDEENFELLGVRIPHLKIPVRPGRSLTSVIEVAARNQLLKLKGIFSARELQEKLAQQLMTGRQKDPRLRDLIE